MKEKFSLQHTVLYAKGWYLRTDNIWDDIKKMLSLDGYSGEFFTNKDCTRLILIQFERLIRKEYRHSLWEVISGISVEECWKYGYFTKDHEWVKRTPDTYYTNEYDLNESIVRYCLSHFSMLDKSEWESCKPNYDKYPRKEGVSDEKILEFFS